jgi:hypothetical protein
MKWLCEVANPLQQNWAQELESIIGFRISTWEASEVARTISEIVPGIKRILQAGDSKAGWPGLAVRCAHPMAGCPYGETCVMAISH